MENFCRQRFETVEKVDGGWSVDSVDSFDSILQEEMRGFSKSGHWMAVFKGTVAPHMESTKAWRGFVFER